MFNKISFKILHNLFVVILFAIQFTANPGAVTAQDRAIHQTLRFKPGTTQAYLNKRINRGTSHVYHFRARKGQQMTASLKVGKKTSFTIYSINSGRIEEAAGVHNWEGNLSETGEYLLEIGTDVSTNYQLTVIIK